MDRPDLVKTNLVIAGSTGSTRNPPNNAPVRRGLRRVGRNDGSFWAAP